MLLTVTSQLFWEGRKWAAEYLASCHICVLSFWLQSWKTREQQQSHGTWDRRRDAKGQRCTKLDTNRREHLQRTLKDVLTGEKGNDRSLSASLHTHQGDLFSHSINISAMWLSGLLICWELLSSNVLGTRQKVLKKPRNLCSVLCRVSI